jgi:hypothetical protein
LFTHKVNINIEANAHTKGTAPVYDMKKYWGVEVKLHPFSKSVLDGGGRLYVSAALLSGKKPGAI